MFTPQRSYYDQEKIKTVSGLLLLPQRATRDGSKMVLLKAWGSRKRLKIASPETLLEMHVWTPFRLRIRNCLRESRNLCFRPLATVAPTGEYLSTSTFLSYALAHPKRQTRRPAIRFAKPLKLSFCSPSYTLDTQRWSQRWHLLPESWLRLQRSLWKGSFCHPVPKATDVVGGSQ